MSPDTTRWLRVVLLVVSGVCAVTGLTMVGVACFVEPLESTRPAELVTAAFSVISVGVVALLFASLATRCRTRSRPDDRRDG